MKTVYQVLTLEGLFSGTISYFSHTRKCTEQLIEKSIGCLVKAGRKTVHGTLEGLASLYQFPSYTSGNVLSTWDKVSPYESLGRCYTCRTHQLPTYLSIRKCSLYAQDENPTLGSVGGLDYTVVNHPVC